MVTILLSIKPQYAKRIFEGTKKYEYRKHLAQNNVNKIIVYSAAPEKLVIGEVEVVDTLSMKPSTLWEATKKDAGISRSNYRAYFRGCSMAYAYRLGEATLFETPKVLAEYGINQAPQSFVYLNS